MGDRKIRFVGPEEWRKATEQGAAPDDLALLKSRACQVKAAGDRAFEFVISTASVDRDGDTIAVDGWQLDAYKKNPVVLWAHDRFGLPVGKSPWVAVVERKLRARVEFPEEGVYAFADTVRRMTAAGFLNTTSVGFLPREGKWNETRGGFDFSKQELLEWSIVPVPSNPDAIGAAKRMGIDVAPVREWCEKWLDGEAGPGLWLPREAVERALKLVGNAPVSVAAPVPVADGPVVDKFLALAKRGRVLSAANEERLRAARTSAADLSAALDDVLAQVGEPEPAEEPKAAPVAVRLRAEKRVSVDKAEIGEFVKVAVQRAVEKAVANQIRRHTGRLD